MPFGFTECVHKLLIKYISISAQEHKGSSAGIEALDALIHRWI